MVMAVPRRLIKEALELPLHEREELLRALLDGLDEPGQDDGHGEAWDAEIERRVRDDENDDQTWPTAAVPCVSSAPTSSASEAVHDSPRSPRRDPRSRSVVPRAFTGRG